VKDLKKQVTNLTSEKNQALARLARSESKHWEVDSQLSWARTNVSLLRDKIARLEQTVAELESAAETYVYEDPETYSDPYSDSYGDSYGSDLDCDDYSYDNFDPGPGDPYGLDSDGDGVACES